MEEEAEEEEEEQEQEVEEDDDDEEEEDEEEDDDDEEEDEEVRGVRRGLTFDVCVCVCACVLCCDDHRMINIVCSRHPHNCTIKNDLRAKHTGVPTCLRQLAMPMWQGVH